MNGKSTDRVTAGPGRWREPVLTRRDREIFQAHLLDEPLKLPHPDPRSWSHAIVENRETHLRMADRRGRLEWLIAFGSRVGTLPEDWPPATLAREISLFMVLSWSSVVEDYLARAAFYAIMDAPNPDLVRRTAKDLSIQVGEGIAAFVDDKAWKITIDHPVTRTISRRPGSQGAHTAWATPNPRAFRLGTGLYARNVHIWSTTFLLKAADEVVAEAAHIRRCAGCASIFIADDPRSLFHSKKCATATRVSAWRTDKKLEAEAKRSKTRKHKRSKAR
jgi:hypothetical protein